MSVTVRRAEPKDARTVAGYAIKLFAQHREYDSRRFMQIASVEGAESFYSSRIEADNAAVLIAEIENKIVDFAYLEFESLNYAALLENAVRLHDLYVEETARGQSAGRLLVEKAAEIAAGFGADKLVLTVAAKNERARKFFERDGFKTTMVEMMLNLTAESDD